MHEWMKEWMDDNYYDSSSTWYYCSTAVLCARDVLQWRTYLCHSLPTSMYCTAIVLQQPTIYDGTAHWTLLCRCYAMS